MKFPREFDYYGGAVVLAEALGVEPHCVRNWKRYDKVPEKYVEAVRKIVRKEQPPAPQPEPAPTQVRLSDIADLIADFLRERGL